MIRKLGVGAALAVLLLSATPSSWAASDETYRQLDLFGDVFVRIGQDYVEEVEDSALIEAAINGMLRSLDPHSSYLNPKTYRDMQVQTRGEFGGLGSRRPTRPACRPATTSPTWTASRFWG